MLNPWRGCLLLIHAQYIRSISPAWGKISPAPPHLAQVLPEHSDLSEQRKCPKVLQLLPDGHVQVQAGWANSFKTTVMWFTWKNRLHHPQRHNAISIRRRILRTQGPKGFCRVASPTRCPLSLRASSTICGTGTSMICCTGRWTNRSSNRACGGSKMLLGVGTNELLWNCIHTTSFNFDSSFCMITGVTSNSSCIWCTGTSTTSQKECMKRSCQHLVMDNVRPDGNMPGKDGACNTNCCVLQWRM